ncbi:MAG TPA: cysteine dioxygenase family protein [Candidatus Dormibacteraeota bacterium]|jgi:cysteine dioxygenase|nr:cysteine dioxygenase family protein [Candidatus Dormibacteraeota bacterium]
MPNNLAVEQLSISDWVKNLAAIPARDFSLENVQDYITRHHVRPETLDKYCYFSKGCYTRNLIFKNDLFECMSICWEIGQFSRVHNHRDQNCWMSAPIGRLKVQNFRVEDRHASAVHSGTCRLVATDIYEMNAANPVHVNPLEPVHQVLNLSEYNERAVSIHIYSKPFDSCEVYQLEKGTYGDVPLHYTSEYGRLNPDEKLI